MIALRYVVASMILAMWGDPSGAPPVIEGLPTGYSTALYVPAQAENEAEQAWTQLAAALDFVRSTRESLAQAETLRATAAKLAQAASGRQKLVAESQLALAEDLLAQARKVSESAVVIFEFARQNALRLQGDEESLEPDDFIRPDAPGLFRIVRPQGAARRSRHA